MFFNMNTLKINILLMLSTGVIGLDINHWGTYFVVTFPKGYGDHTKSVVVITTREHTNISVTSHSNDRQENFTLLGNQSERVEYGTEVEARPYGITLEKVSLSVKASRKVSVYALVYDNVYLEGFLVLPVASLGTDYMAVNMYNDGPGYTRTQIVITAIENNTTVTVTLKSSPLQPYCWTSLSRVRVWTGKIFTFHLNSSDAVNVYCQADTTGSRINSTKPVAVITGSRFLNFPEDAFADPIIEMLPPVTEFGTHFALIAPHGHTSQRALLRVVTLNVDTSFIVKGVEHTPEMAESVDIWLNASEKVCFTATDKVIVMLFMSGTGGMNEYIGDASMSIIPPVTRATNDYVLARNLMLPYTQDYTEGIDIIMAASTSVPGSYSSPSSSFDILCNNYNISSSISDFYGVTRYLSPSPFIMLVYGYGLRTAYSYPAGMMLSDYSGIEECSSSPCQNGGWCLETSSSFTCYCSDDRYTGHLCEIDSEPTTPQITTETTTTTFTTESTITHTLTSDITTDQTTQLPTTESKTAEDYTTEVQTTEHPTTEIQTTTEAPITEAQPTTEAPITEAQPTTEAPITEAQPTTEAPITEAQPTTEAPITEAQPTTEAPITEAQPSTEAPITEAQPTTEAPITEAQPTTEAPITEAQPSTEAPITEAQPTTEAPITEAQPTTEAPITEAQTTETPTTEAQTTEALTTEAQTTGSQSTEALSQYPPTEPSTPKSSSTHTTPSFTAVTGTPTQPWTTPTQSTTTVTLPNSTDVHAVPFSPKRINFTDKPCAGSQCLCQCPCLKKLATKSEVIARAEEEQTLLKVKTTELSKTRRKKESAENQIQTENELGLGTFMVMSTVFIGFVILDILPTLVWIWERLTKKEDRG